MKPRSPSGPVPRGPSNLLVGLLLAIVTSGCASRAPEEPPPRALADADRLARQAAQLQAAQNWPGAASWWQRAALQFQMLHQPVPLAVAWHNEAVCRRELGQWEEARTLLEDAAALNERTGQTNAWWRNQLALVQLEATVPDASPVPRLNRLLPRRTEPDQPVQAILAHEAARSLLGQMDAQAALRELAGAELLFTRLHDAQGLAAVRLTQARAQVQLGDPVAAEAAWRDALQRFQALGNLPGIALSMAGLGSTLADGEDRVGEAEWLLSQAIENLGNLGIAPSLQSAEDRLRQLRSTQPQPGP